MFKGIRRRLLSYYLVVIAFIVIAVGAFFIWFLHYFYMQTLRENLFIQARLAATVIEEMLERNAGAEEIDLLAKDLGREFGVRITLVDAAGTVLADSAEDPLRMDNHRDRPEIREALEQNKGVALRYSVTLDEEMLYLAVPLQGITALGDPATEPAVVRLALSLAGINRAVMSLYLFIAGALLLSSLAALAAAVILARRITGPISKISAAAHSIAGGNYNPTFEVPGTDELSALAVNIKEMGRSLSKKIDQVLAEKNKLETIITSMSSGVILTDRDMKIELINPAAEVLFDLKREKAIGEPLQKALRYYALHENLKAVYADSKSRLIEINLYYPRQVVLETYLLPVFGAGGKIIGVLLLFHEVTHLRSLEKMRSDFVANVSHELRTPLTAIRGYTETILHEDLTGEQLLDFLKVIDRETARLAGLLDDLLDLAQIENEKSFVKKSRIELAAVIAEAVERVEEIGKKKKTLIEVDIQAESITVNANQEWLCQALINILENSIRHGKTGGNIKISLSGKEGKATVEIKDDGPGIPEADLPYVFERFYRVDKSRSRKSGSTGLGLSIVKHIMEAHNAAYALNSRAGEGALFRFTLPLCP